MQAEQYFRFFTMKLFTESDPRAVFQCVRDLKLRMFSHLKLNREMLKECVSWGAGERFSS